MGLLGGCSTLLVLWLRAGSQRPAAILPLHPVPPTLTVANQCHIRMRTGPGFRRPTRIQSPCSRLYQYPDLNLSLVREIADLVDVPLAMHGASGLAFDRYGSIIDSGISKINYYTAIARAVTHQLRDLLVDATEDQLG